MLRMQSKLGWFYGQTERKHWVRLRSVKCWKLRLNYPAEKDFPVLGFFFESDFLAGRMQAKRADKSRRSRSISNVLCFAIQPSNRCWGQDRFSQQQNALKPICVNRFKFRCLYFTSSGLESFVFESKRVNVIILLKKRWSTPLLWGKKNRWFSYFYTLV